MIYLLTYAVRFFFHNRKRTLQATMTLTLALVIFIATTLLVRGYAGNIAGMASIIQPSNYYLINESDMSLSESKLDIGIWEFLDTYSIDTPNVEVVLPQLYIPITVEGETGVKVDTHLRLVNFTRFELYQQHQYQYTLSEIDSDEFIMGQQLATLLSSGVDANVGVISSEIYVNSSFTTIISDNFSVSNIIKSGQEYDLELIGDLEKWLPILNVQYVSFIELKVLDTRLIEETKEDILNEFQDIEITEEKQTQNFIIFATDEVIRTLTLLQILFFILMLVSISYSIYTLVKESEEEIFILRSIGATKSQIVLLFITQAALIGLLSSILSIIIGYLAVSSIVAIVSSSIGLPYIALNFELSLVGTIFAFAMGLSLLSGIYPSITASKIRVVREEL